MGALRNFFIGQPPPPPPERKTEKVKVEIVDKLYAIDREAVRPFYFYAKIISPKSLENQHVVFKSGVIDIWFLYTVGSVHNIELIERLPGEDVHLHKNGNYNGYYVGSEMFLAQDVPEKMGTKRN